MQDFTGSGAIVTGGASGLGAATARLLAKNGINVTLFDLNEHAGEALASKIGAKFLRVDVSDPQSVAQGVDAAEKANGVTRILANCAGIGGRQIPYRAARRMIQQCLNVPCESI